MKKRLTIQTIAAFAFTAMFCFNAVSANPYSSMALRKAIADSVNAYLSGYADNPRKAAVRHISGNRQNPRIYFTPAVAEFSLTAEMAEDIHSIAEHFTGSRRSRIFAGNIEIEDLISYSPDCSESRQEFSRKYGRRNRYTGRPLVERLYVQPYEPYLHGKHIALWSSHGRYYEQSLQRWQWQRASLLQTVEDLFTGTYVNGYLARMLENSGAVVLMPKERDMQTHETIVDNDSPESGYSETDGAGWKHAGLSGFSIPAGNLRNGENPFMKGTCRYTESESGKELARWTPEIPENGEYAVYVSYAAMPESTDRAIYRIHYPGGTATYSVNQRMGGGTWIYLGTHTFAEGRHDGQFVEIMNGGKGSVSADAVKFGGGMGNIERETSPRYVDRWSRDTMEKSGLILHAAPSVSGMPRYAEAARYWLQWAGFSDTVYSDTGFLNDYADDLRARGKWVNVLGGGSVNDPDRTGYGIPVDLAVAVHTDAGLRGRDSTVGTLAIYTEKNGRRTTFPDRRKRRQSRELADLIQTQIVDDARFLHDSTWNRRGLWNRDYSETGITEVPSAIIEMFSHQNPADMNFGHDPSFQFDVSRSIYKGIVRYISLLEDREAVIQPLPVKGIRTSIDRKSGKAVIRVEWEATHDPLEISAEPEGYVVRIRKSSPHEEDIRSSGFDSGTYVEETSFELVPEYGFIYSFIVEACNAGGKSFPSETVSAGIHSDDAPVAAVVNAFTYTGYPSFINLADSLHWTYDNRTSYVPYGSAYDLTGIQFVTDRSSEWTSDDYPGFGASGSEYQNGPVSGNSFDYNAVHGKAFMRNGFSFAGMSAESVTSGKSDITGYDAADIYYGTSPAREDGIVCREMKNAIAGCMEKGGTVILSGSGLFPAASKEGEDRFFRDTMGCMHLTPKASGNMEISGAGNPFTGKYSINSEYSCRKFRCHDVSGVQPAGRGSCTVYRYSDTGIPAASASVESGRKCIVAGFPAEAMANEEDIVKFIEEIRIFFGN